MCSRHAALLVLATLLFWLPCCILPCAARVGRIYSLANATVGGNWLTMQDMISACKSQTNGSVAIADSAEKEIEIINYYGERMPWFVNGSNVYLQVGGVTLSNRPDGKPPQSIKEARWCWVYDDVLCGPNNETLIGTHDGNKFVTAPGRYSNWHMNYPTFSTLAESYITLRPSIEGWYSGVSFKDATIVCVAEGRIPDPTEAPPVNPTDPPKKNLWWISLIVLAVVLLLAIVIGFVVLCYCCGTEDLEEVDDTEDDDRLSNVRDTQCNRSAISGGGSRRSMGSRRGSAYSASQCDSQGDVEDYNSNGDDRVYQGRSADSYYYY